VLKCLCRLRFCIYERSSIVQYLSMDYNNSGFSESPEPSETSTLTKLSYASGVLWIVIGFSIIHFFHDRSILEILSDGTSIWTQILTGIIAGWIFGIIGRWMFRNPNLKKTLDDYLIIKELKKFSLTNLQILQISIVAGISEEILFRAALQPIIGIWLTSLIFIGVHGYIRFKTWGHSLFTIFTFMLSVLLGLLFIYFGIISAILAHAIYDILLLRELRNVEGFNNNSNSIDLCKYG